MYIKEFSGQELHQFLSEGLKKFDVKFEDAELNGSKEPYIVALGDEDEMFQKMFEQKYVSLCDEHGEEIYGDYPLY